MYFRYLVLFNAYEFTPLKICDISGQYNFKDRKKPVTNFVTKAFLAYFKVKLGGQDKLLGLHFVCKACVKNLRKWTNNMLAGLRFGVPMVRTELKNYYVDFHFYLVYIKGFNCHRKSNWNYPDLECARRPVPYCEEVPVPEL